MRTTDQERAIQERLTKFQQIYDSCLEPLKRSAAPPPQGIGVNEYRRRSLGFIQQFLPPDSKWHNVSLDGCMSDALSAIEPQILAEAQIAATNPQMLAHTPAARPDAFDPNIKAVKFIRGGKEMTEYYGEHFVKGMGRKGRRVISFLNNPRLMPQR
jgi:hypothetical protein